YAHGLFRQEMSEGWQVELPEDWLTHGNPWEFERRESAYEIGFGGHVEPITDADGTVRQEWRPNEHLLAVAYDTPIVGWRGARVNTLRLWSAQPIDPILLDKFNSGDHIGALEESAKAEAITRVLYPADSTAAGQELRLRQEFFFSSASLQDIVRRHLQQYGDLGSLPDKVAIQLNDTHPAISIAEMMRILMDVQGGLGPGVDADAQDLRLYQPHAAARSAGNLAGRAARTTAAAPDADRLRHQRHGAGRGAGKG